MKKRIRLFSWIGSIIGKPPGWERIVRRVVPPVVCKSLPETCVVRDESLFLIQPWVPLGWHVLLFDEYEPEVRKIIKNLLRPGFVALDTGANVGWHTLLMAKRVGHSGRVVAVEANPSVRKILEFHITLNRVENTVVLPVVASSRLGRVKFLGPQAEEAHSGDGHVVREEAVNPSGLMEIDAQPIDYIIEQLQLSRLDFIKVDVEGYEWPVLQGAREALIRFQPHLIFEFDENYTKRGNGDAGAIHQFLESLGYRLFVIQRYGAKALQFGEWPKSANILATPTSRARKVS